MRTPKIRATHNTRDGVEKPKEKKLQILTIYEDDRGNIFAWLKIEEGKLSIGDHIDIPETQYKGTYMIRNMFLNDIQESAVAVRGEYVKVFLGKSVTKTKGTPVKECYVNHLTMTGHAALAVKISEMSGECYKKISDCIPINEENIADLIMKYGLKLIIAPSKVAIKNAPKIAVATAIGVFAAETYRKLITSCAKYAVIGRRKKCLADAARKVQTELRRQAAACNELNHPKKRAACLKAVEKERAKWIKIEAKYTKAQYAKRF